MWTYRLAKPGLVERAVVPDAKPRAGQGEVLLRLCAAGLCGSDMPRYKGALGPRYEGGWGTAPVHEVVGEVLEDGSGELRPGQRVVGTLGREGGLAELVVASASKLVPVPEELSDVEAVTIQPLSTVLRAVAKLPETRRARATVLGAGPIGLAFCHALRQRGVAHLSAVDPVERSEVAKAFGADEFYCMTSSEWLRSVAVEERPQLVVEAVGHQQGTLRDAIYAVAEHGFVLGFGEPDEADYALPYEQLYLKDATLASGCTMAEEWRKVLLEGSQYLLRYRADFKGYVSHVVEVEDAQVAYCLYAQPQAGRIKVVIVP